jgi:hypothetical protein
VCKAIWDVEGTECSGSKLLEFTDAVHKATQPHPRSLMLDSASSSSERSLETTSLLGQSRNLFGHFGVHSGGFHQLLNIHEIVKKAMASHHQHFFRLQKILKQTGVFRSSMMECWTYLSHARDVSLCYTCTPHSSKFFFRKKALVTENECNRMLGACLPFFRVNIEIISEAGSEEVSKQLFENKPHQGDLVKELYQAIEKAELKKLVQEYDQGAGKVKQFKADVLCLKLFRLYNHPLFFMLDNARHKIKTAVGNERKLLRMEALQSLHSSANDPFAGDISIIKQDGGYQFIQTSSGTQPINLGSFKPMNLTLAFP